MRMCNGPCHYRNSTMEKRYFRDARETVRSNGCLSTYRRNRRSEDAIMQIVRAATSSLGREREIRKRRHSWYLNSMVGTCATVTCAFEQTFLIFLDVSRWTSVHVMNRKRLFGSTRVAKRSFFFHRYE